MLFFESPSSRGYVVIKAPVDLNDELHPDIRAVISDCCDGEPFGWFARPFRYWNPIDWVVFFLYRY